MKQSWDIPESEVTDKKVYLSRREFMRGVGAVSIAGLMPTALAAETVSNGLAQVEQPGPYTRQAPQWLQDKVRSSVPGGVQSSEALTPYEYVSRYNNFYEFGTAKDDPFKNAQNFKTDPWQLTISGEAELTGSFQLEDILKPHDLEERIYRLRCVEAWSMVVPWLGFPLADLIKRFKPSSRAKYVRFQTLYDPSQMPGQASRFTALDYPYVEGLRIDEAMNDLAFVSLGLYGEVLPPQNGAPLRLVVPWKYGFKSIKSIVGIEFTSERPLTTWEKSGPREYGFYANVNPEVDHPRWSQATERRLPNSLFSPNRIDTLMFNGYAQQVASLYKGMDLRRNF